MLVSDLLHSCANERVAEAAVSSIGGEFARRMHAEAADRGVTVGFLAASIVRRFARDASERDWRELVDAVRGKDFPVLEGLQLVLTKPPRVDTVETNRGVRARGMPPSGTAHPTNMANFISI